MPVTPAQLLVDVRRLLDQRFPIGDIYADRYTDLEVQAALARALPRVQAQVVGRFGGSLAETLTLGQPDQNGLITLPGPAVRLVSLSAKSGSTVWRLRALPPGQGRLVPGQAIPGLEARWIPHWVAPATDADPYAFGQLQPWELLVGQQLAATAALDLVTITGTVPQGLMMHAEGLERDLGALPLPQSYRSLVLPMAFPDSQAWDAAYWLTSPTEVLVWWL